MIASFAAWSTPSVEISGSAAARHYKSAHHSVTRARSEGFEIPSAACQMDAATAALLGAAIGLTGTVVAPMVTAYQAKGAP